MNLTEFYQAREAARSRAAVAHERTVRWPFSAKYRREASEAWGAYAVALQAEADALLRHAASAGNRSSLLSDDFWACCGVAKADHCQC